MKLKNSAVFFALSLQLALALLSHGANESSTRTAELSTGIASKKDLEATISQLHQSDKKYPALFKLIDYASPELFRSGSIFTFSEHPDWIETAAAAVNSLSNSEVTITYCLENGTELAKRWAINCAANDKKYYAELIKIATTENSSTIINQVLERLPSDQQEKVLSILRGRATVDPYLLETLYKTESTFNQKLTGLLRSNDEKVRIDALNFIGADGALGLNPQARHSFDGEVYNEVIKLAQSKSVAEKASACTALIRVGSYDTTRSKEAFLLMSQDADPDIRWRSAAGLVPHRGQKDVDNAIEKLLSDPSAKVQYMTIVALPERSKYQKKLEELGRSVSEFSSPNAIVPINSAAATAWVAATPSTETPRQFLLANQPNNAAGKKGFDELLNEIRESIKSKIAELKSNGQDAKADELEKQLTLSAKSASDADDYKQLRMQLNKQKPDLKKEDVYIVNASSSEWPRVERVHERSVRVCNTNVPVILGLFSGDQEGTKWQVSIDPGVQLKRIVLSGNGLQKTTVSGNFDKSTTIEQKEPGSKDSVYTVWASDNANDLENRALVSAFCVAHFGQDATTIQVVKDSPKDSKIRQKIVVGPTNPEWCRALSLKLLEPIAQELRHDANQKFRENFKGAFPFVISTPAESGWRPALQLNSGLCSKLQGKIQSQIYGTNIQHQFEFAGIAYDPNANQAYFAGRRQVFVLDKNGNATPMVPPEMSRLFENDTIRGVAFDTRRKRLVITSGKQALAYEPTIKKWDSISLDPFANSISCYSEDDDSLYSRSDKRISRVDAKTGKIVEHGYIPITNDTLLKQMQVAGNYLIFISEAYPVPNGVQQLATVIDKRDGSLAYQDVCFFSKLK